jgi:hypothetical protein
MDLTTDSNLPRKWKEVMPTHLLMRHKWASMPEPVTRVFTQCRLSGPQHVGGH